MCILDPHPMNLHMQRQRPWARSLSLDHTMASSFCHQCSRGWLHQLVVAAHDLGPMRDKQEVWVCVGDVMHSKLLFSLQRCFLKLFSIISWWTLRKSPSLRNIQVGEHSSEPSFQAHSLIDEGRLLDFCLRHVKIQSTFYGGNRNCSNLIPSLRKTLRNTRDCICTVVQFAYKRIDTLVNLVSGTV